MSALGNIDIQVLDGAGNRNYSKMADNLRRRAIINNNAKRNVIKYHTNGVNNSTFKSIDAVVNGLDFIGYVGDGSIEDSEMLRSHLVRTKNIVDSAPQMFAGYQQPQQLSQMLGYVIEHWDTPDREAAIDNMAREERKLIAVGAIKTDSNDSDAHYLTDDEIYDADRQDVVKNGMVETKPGYRGLFNRIKQAGVNANVLSKDAEVVTDNTLTRKAVGALREAVKKARKDRPKAIRKTRIQNGYVHTSTVKLPQQTATTADTIRILSRTPEGKKLAATIKKPTVNGLGEIEQGTFTELMHGTDFAFNGTDGLSGTDNVDNYRRYFLKLRIAITRNPKGFYNTQAEADAVLAMLDELYYAVGDEAALDRMIAKYSGGVGSIDGGLAGKLLKKVKNAVKKTATAVKTATKNVAKATANAAKQVAKTTANVTKAAAKTTANAVKSAAKATANVTKAAVKSTVNATKAAANVVKAGAQAATGNKAKAKETLKKAGQQAKSAVTQPVKAVVSSTKDVVKKTVVEPTKTAVKTAVKETKAVVKNAVVEPTKTIVKETIVNPTKAALKITKKVTKVIGKVAKKVIKAVLLYNPITLLIKAGLLIAFRLNMFKISSRSYAGSYSEADFAVFAEKNGIEVSNYDKFKQAYDKIHKICCGTLGMKESKVLAALEKGSKRKWAGLDAADFSENEEDIKNSADFTSQIKEASEEADNSAEFQAEMQEINADTAAEEADLKKQGAQASADAPTDQLITKKNVETTEMVDAVTNGKVLKKDAPLYETADTKGKQLVALKKGDTVYIDASQAKDNFIAAATVDGKNGFVDKTALAGFATAEDILVNGIAGLVDNGYEYVAGLGEAVTAAAGTAAASGWIATVCAFIAKIFKGGISLIKKAGKKVVEVGKKVFNKGKNVIENLTNNGEENGDEIQETEEMQTPLTEEQQEAYEMQAQLPTMQAVAQNTIAQSTAQSKSKIGLAIGIGAAVVAAGVGIYFATKD